MLMNKKKSTIVPIYDEETKEEINGIPVKDKYKYLGIWIDNTNRIHTGEQQSDKYLLQNE